jgi:hypothetical protein
MNTVTKMLYAYADADYNDVVLRDIVLCTIIPVLNNLNEEQKYSSYLTVINFPEKSIKNGEILLRKMIELDIISKPILYNEKTVYFESLPQWVQKVLK